MEPLRHHHARSHSRNSRSHIPTVTVNYGPSKEQIKHAKRKELARPNVRRTLIRLFTLAVGLSIVAVLGQATAVWYTTRNDVLAQPSGLRMPGWPQGMNLTPTYVMLSVAVIAILVQVVSALTLCGPIRRLRESNLHTWTVFFTSVAGVIIWLAAAIYFKLQDSTDPGHWTLWSWSCNHKDLTNGKMSFEGMCVKLNYCFYAALIVGVLEIVSLVLFGLKLRNVKKEGSHYTKVTVEAI